MRALRPVIAVKYDNASSRYSRLLIFAGRPSFGDYVLTVLRKATFSREPLARAIGVAGLAQLAQT